jgi:hypothetical protein
MNDPQHREELVGASTAAAWANCDNSMNDLAQ